ncbi:site-specific integrase [Priestia megaterium]|uniref:site-specific integrase n=1 Tax=Priestia megaterium TaxID=1404 RepID=UPI0035B64486
MEHLQNTDVEIFEGLSDSEYNLEDSIKLAKSVLIEFKNENPLNDCNFENETWYLYDTTNKVNRLIHFQTLLQSEFIYKDLKINLKQVLKCWVTSLIDKELSPVTIAKAANCLIDIMNTSNNFSTPLLSKTIEYIKQTSARTRIFYCNTILNFLDYYQVLDCDDVYTEEAWQIKSSTKFKVGIREIPSSHDILKFSMIVEDFFNKKISNLQYRKYYCIYLWWNLTTIIPLRISEFCDIKRDALIQNGSEFHLKLPRKKQNNRRVQVIDTILIPTSLAESILKYIISTKNYGDSSTLISYPSIPFGEYYKEMKIDKRSFHAKTMGYLLNCFYEEIVFNKYGLKLLNSELKLHNQDASTHQNIISRKIRPNDTRHFAFLNLMTQGYHPVEIARLGGHNSIYSQYHYHQHLEYWIDSEVMELMLKFNLNKNSNIKDIVDNKKFKEKYILRPPIDNDVKIPLSLGYCTDPNQSCQVDECVFCEHWRITFEEYKEKTDVINRKISSQKSVTKTLINNIKDLHNIAIKNIKSDLYSETNNLFNKELNENAKQLKHSLYKLAKLKVQVNFDEQ